MEKERDGLSAQLAANENTFSQSCSTSTTAIEVLEKTCADQKKQLQTQAAELDELNDVISGLEVERDKLNVQFKEMQDEMSKKISDMGAINSISENLKEEVDRLQFGEIKLRSECDAYKEEVKVLNSKIKALDDEIRQEREEVVKKNCQVERLTSDMGTIRADMRAQADSLKRLEDSAVELRASLRESNSENQIHTTDIKRLEQELKKLRADCTEEEKKNAVSNARLISAEEQLNQSQKDNTSLQNQLDNALMRLQKDIDRVRELNETNVILKIELSNKNHAADLLNRELAQIRENHSEQHAETSRQLEEALRALAAEKSANDLLISQGGMMLTAGFTSTDEFQKLSDQITGLQSCFDYQTKSSQIESHRMVGLQEELAETRRANEVLQLNIAKLQSDLERSESHNTRVFEDLTIAKDSHASISAELDNTSQELKALKDKADKSYSEVAVLHARAQLYAERIDQLEKEVHVLRGELEECQKQNAIDQSSTAVLETRLEASQLALLESEESVQVLRERTMSLEADLRVALNSVTWGQEEMSQSKQLQKSQSAELDELNDVIAGMEPEIRILEEANKTLQAKLIANAADYEGDKAELTRVLEELTLKMSSGESSMELVQEDLRSAQNRSQQLESAVSDLRDMLTQKEKDLQNRAEEFRKLSLALASAKEEAKLKDSATADTQKAMEKLLSNNEQLQKQLNEMELKQHTLQSASTSSNSEEVKILQKEIMGLKDELLIANTNAARSFADLESMRMRYAVS